MPFYNCFSPEGFLTAEQKREIAVGMTEIHCGLTGAPRQFVHVMHQTYRPEDTFAGGEPSKACNVRAFIRAGRTQAVKEELLRRITRLWIRVSGIEPENLLVSLSETPGTNVMEGGILLSDPNFDAAWIEKHGRAAMAAN